jgi:hypothetical protein
VLGDECLNLPFPLQLRASVNAEGVRAIIFSIGPILAPVKHIVGADIQQSGADFRTSPCDIPRPQRIYPFSLRWILFATIDVSVGSEMKNEFGAEFVEGAFNGGFFPDVKIL